MIMAGEDKTSLDQIEAGDTVAYKDSGRHYPLAGRVVDKVTATQIIIDNARFRKDDGREITTGSYKARIHALADFDFRANVHMTYLQMIEVEQAEHDDERERYKFALFISNLPARRMTQRFDAATLEQAAKLLGYTEDGA